MLVLTRKIGEGIAIGEDIKVIVMQIKGKQVRLGIKASPATSVHREEVFEKIQDENRRATSSNLDFVTRASVVMDPSPTKTNNDSAISVKSAAALPKK